MNGSIKDYLERQHTENLKGMLDTFFREDMLEEYGYAIDLIKEELRKREE